MVKKFYSILMVSLDEQKRIGGKQKSIEYLTKGLEKRGHKVILVDGRLHAFLDIICRGSAKLLDLFNRSLATRYDATVRAFLVALKARKHLKKVDIVHTHDFLVAESMLHFCQRIRIKTPIITTITAQSGAVHELLANGFLSPRSSHTKKMLKSEAEAYKAMDQVDVNASLTKKKVCKELGLPGGKVKVIYRGCPIPDEPLERNSIKKKLMIFPNSFVITSTATFRPVKRLNVFIASAPFVLHEVPNALFLIVGDGYLRPQLERQISSLNLQKRVKLLGFRSDVYSILKASDLYVQPSRNEALGVAIIEAMSMKLPVVATSVGGIPEVVEDGVTGILVPPENPEALASAIIHLYRNPELRKRMGKLGKRRFEQHFTVDRMVEDYERLYVDVLSKEKVKQS